MARAETRLGMWDSAIVHSERAVQLNPRSVSISNALGNVYMLVRRYADAGRACNRAAQLTPNNTLTVFCLARVPLAQGDLAGARAIVRAASPGIDSTVLYVFLASYGAYTWVLDESQQRALLTIPAKAFERGPASRLEIRMLLYDELGDPRSSRTYAESAAVALQADNGGAAADSDVHYGLALAYAGRQAEAIAAGDRFLAGRTRSMVTFSTARTTRKPSSRPTSAPVRRRRRSTCSNVYCVCRAGSPPVASGSTRASRHSGATLASRGSWRHDHRANSTRRVQRWADHADTGRRHVI